MLRQPQTYYFGRLNIIAAYTNKRDFLYNGLLTEELLMIRDFYWGFFNIESFSDQTGDYFTGYLAKYKPLIDEEIADEEFHKISIESAENRISAKSRFFLHTESGLLAYHRVGYKIKRNQFANNFCHLFESAYANFFINTEIQAIDDRIEILKIIHKLDYISQVSFYLHPSNPKSADWKRIDQRLKDLNVSGYKESYQEKQGGHLNVLEDQEFNDKLNMAVDGYGEATITGSLEGQERTIHTKTNPTSAKTYSEDKNYRNVFQDLHRKIIEIFERFDKHEDQ